MLREWRRLARLLPRQRSTTTMMPRSLRSIRHLGAAAALSLSLGAVGCSHSYIPNTDVEDSAENRDIIAFCERYRRAV